MIALLAAGALALPQWAGWKYERSIANTHQGTIAIVVPPSLYANAQRSLADVRIVTSAAAVPFAIVTPPPPDNIQWVEAKLSDSGYVPHHYSQTVADVGEHMSPYDNVELATTTSSFATSARVEASDDRRSWRVIRTGAPIYDYASDGLATNLRVAIPPTTARYLRVVVARDDFPITGIRVAVSTTEPRELTRYGIAVHDVTPAGQKDSVFSLDGIRDVPIERIEVDSSTPRYARDAEIQSNDGSGWSTISQTQLFRSGNNQTRSFDFGETQGTQWRLVVHNGDDAPLGQIIVRAFGAPRRIVFDAHAGEYVLIYGNPNATPVSYDFAQTHPAAFGSSSALALGAPGINPAFVSAGDTRPWTERNRWLVWVALGVAVLAIGALSIRALRGDPSEPA